jgi:glutathione S-transferase
MDDEIAKGEGPWLLGARLSLADICVMPTVVRLADLGLDGMWAKRPRIGRWFDAIRSHPAFRPTYYFGSLLSERFPHVKENAASLVV